MARGRMISRSLGTASRKFREVHGRAGKLGDFAQALFPLLVVNSDDFGRLQADAFTVKHSIFPTSPHSEHDFECAIQAMAAVNLVQVYTGDDGRMYAQILNFDREQPGLHKRTKSRFPEPPRHFPEFPGSSRNVPESHAQQEQEQEQEQEQKEEEERPPLYPPHGGDRAETANSLPSPLTLPAPPDAPQTRGTRAGQRTPLPDHLVLTATMRARIVAVGCRDPEAAFQNFRDVHTKNASRFVDWEGAVWRTFVANHNRFGCPCQDPGPPQRGARALTPTMAAAARVGRAIAQREQARARGTDDEQAVLVRPRHDAAGGVP